MLYRTKLGLLVLTTALSIGSICAAQQNPGGSYQQTCRDIGTRGSTLYATCRDGVGGWRSTELRDFSRCSGEIQNINGQLQCSTGANQGYGRGPYGDRGYGGAPRGSYTQTCQGINTSGNTLQASCQTKNGKWKQTSLRNYTRCTGEVINNNGKLECTR
jgi:CVNH domain